MGSVGGVSDRLRGNTKRSPLINLKMYIFHMVNYKNQPAILMHRYICMYVSCEGVTQKHNCGSKRQ